MNQISVPNQTTTGSIYKIIYRSNIAMEGGNAAVMDHIRQILAWSRSWNAKHGITGALMLDDDGFAQVLEGPSHAVKALFGHIICDRRHKDVELLQSDFYEERDFGKWSMAFIGNPEEGDISLTSTAIQRGVVVGQGADGVLTLLRWLLEEQP